jgi:hypothetical protein
MNGSEFQPILDKLMPHKNFFCGIFSIDTIPRHIKKHTFFILNLAKSAGT